MHNFSKPSINQQDSFEFAKWQSGIVPDTLIRTRIAMNCFYFYPHLDISASVRYRTWTMQRRRAYLTDSPTSHSQLIPCHRPGNGVGLIRTAKMTTGSSECSLVSDSGLRNGDGLWNDGLDMTTCNNNGQVSGHVFEALYDISCPSRPLGHIIR